jgi:hypothetical protein
MQCSALAVLHLSGAAFLRFGWKIGLPDVLFVFMASRYTDISGRSLIYDTLPIERGFSLGQWRRITR